MKLLITGGGGFVGARLARTLLARGTLGRRTTRPRRARRPVRAAGRPARRRARRGAHRRRCSTSAPRCASEALRRRVPPRVGGVGRMRGRLRPRHALQPRQHARAARRAARAPGPAACRGSCSPVRWRCSGPTPRCRCRRVVADDTLPAPQTSYGTQKLICEHLVADYTRKGFIDGRAARLMTVTVRPGPAERRGLVVLQRHHPRAAGRASRRSARSSPSVSHPVSSPARTVDGLIAVYEASREALRRPPGAEPAGAERPRRRDARRARAGGRPAVRARVRFERDERIAGIVANWPTGATRSARRARSACSPTHRSPTSCASTSTTARRGPTPRRHLKGLAR